MFLLDASDITNTKKYEDASRSDIMGLRLKLVLLYNLLELRSCVCAQKPCTKEHLKIKCKDFVEC